MLVYFDAAREVVLLTLLVIAAYTDLAYGKVYNWCTAPATVLGLMLGYILGGVDDPSAPFSLAQSAYGILLAGGIFGLGFLFGGFGPADLKLAVAIGALKGWTFTAVAIVYTALIGGVLAVGLLLWKGRLRSGLWDSLRAAVRPWKFRKAAEADSPARLVVPYAFAISAGTLWAWLAFTAKVF